MQLTTVIPNGIGFSDPISKLFLASNTAFKKQYEKKSSDATTPTIILLRKLNLDGAGI